MHCTACDAELILTNVVPENTVAVRGFEHHTFICSGCHSTVRRVVFTRHGREEDPTPPPNLFDHVMARVRGYKVGLSVPFSTSLSSAQNQTARAGA